MGQIPKVILDYNVVSLTNGSVTLGINSLTVDTYEFNWIFARSDVQVLVKVVGEISQKFLPETQKAT